MVKDVNQFKEAAEAKTSALFDKTGSFFAFSQKQFDEAKKEGVKYVRLSFGLICPKDEAKTVIKELEEIHSELRAQELEHLGKKAIIIRELYNYECFYTWELEDAIEVLRDYGITKEEISEAFREEVNKNH